MDPPVRPRNSPSDTVSLVRPKNFSSSSSISHSLSTSPSSSTSTMEAVSHPHDDLMDIGPTTNPISNAPPYSTLGELSFAPATQTTVVVTTTTTTTNFPPFVMKAPGHLHNLDPKIYPLATTPTPQSMKRFCFDVDGKPTFFREAEATGELLQEVSSSLPVSFIGYKNCEGYPMVGLFRLTHAIFMSIVQSTPGSAEIVRRDLAIQVQLRVELRYSRLSPCEPFATIDVELAQNA